MYLYCLRHILRISSRDKDFIEMSSHLVIFPPSFCCSDIEDCAGLPMHIYQMKNGHIPTDFLMRALIWKGMLPILIFTTRMFESVAWKLKVWALFTGRKQQMTPLYEQTLELTQEGQGKALEPYADMRRRKYTHSSANYDGDYGGLDCPINCTCLLQKFYLIFDPKTTHLQWRCHTILFSVRDMQ